MQEALDGPVKALIDESLLKHSDTDVKVSVAACICQIMRIKAPDAPYSDEEMKDVFLLIVSSFENLSDKLSITYDKRISILDTVCKVRLCVTMLQLKCDDLIVKMFEHFLTSIRDDHPGNVFSSMTNIMALALKESKEIRLDMLKPLLASLKNNSRGVSPAARKLGEEVVKSSADKLRPCLKQALKIFDVSLDNYSQVLTLADESKLAPALDDAAQVTKIVNCDDLVGQKVKIWWPGDKRYHEGYVTSFDAAKSKHKVSYLDGTEENLLLSREKWETISEYSDYRTGGVCVSGKSKVLASKSGGGNEAKDDNKSEAVNLKESEISIEDKETKKKEEWQQIVHKSKGRGKIRSKTSESEMKAVAVEANM